MMLLIWMEQHRIDRELPHREKEIFSRQTRVWRFYYLKTNLLHSFRAVNQGFIFQKSPTGRKLSVKTILPVDLILSNDSNRSGSSSRKIRKGDLGQSFALASGCCLETYFSSPAHNLYMPGWKVLTTHK